MRFTLLVEFLVWGRHPLCSASAAFGPVTSCSNFFLLMSEAMTLCPVLNIFNS
jgi:hypothetical protein